MVLTKYATRAVRVIRAWSGVRCGQVLEDLPAARRARLLTLGMVEPCAPPRRRRRSPGQPSTEEDRMP